MHSTPMYLSPWFSVTRMERWKVPFFRIQRTFRLSHQVTFAYAETSFIRSLWVQLNILGNTRSFLMRTK